MNDNEKEAIKQMRGLIYGNWQTCVTYAFAELGIADILYKKPYSLTTLAEATKINPRLLLRFLKCCAQLCFIEIIQGTDEIKLTPFGELLRTDHPLSQRGVARLNGAPFRYEPWGKLVDVLLSGDGGNYSPTHKTGSLAYLKDKPDLLDVFQKAMTNFSVSENEQITSAYDFTPFTHIIDVGSGHGTFINAVLKNNPHLQGTMFDLKETLDGIDKSQLDQGERLKQVAGDFFESVPANGDLYTMKNVLHNWPEQKTIQILQNVHRALVSSPGAPSKRLLIIEYLIPEGNDDNIVNWMDLNFFILVGGSDRTLSEYTQLFSSCGFSVNRLISTPSGRHIIELIVNADPE